MKSFWEKASEISSKAKSFASDYLGTSKEPKKDIEEQEKIFGEKFLTLKTEIDQFKIETIRAAEEKLRGKDSKIESTAKEFESLKKSHDAEILNLEADFCEKEKKYLLQITENEKIIHENNNSIIKYMDSIDELNKELKSIKEKEKELKDLVGRYEQEIKCKKQYESNMECLNELNLVIENLNKTRENIVEESKVYYEIDLASIKTRIENFFLDLRLDYSNLSFIGEEIKNSNEGKTKKGESLKSLNNKIESNLDNITKLIKTVKNELFLVIKNKVESLNKESITKLDELQKGINDVFSTNFSLFEDKINKIKNMNEENSNINFELNKKEQEKLEKEIEELKKGIFEKDDLNNKFKKENENFQNLVSNLEKINDENEKKIKNNEIEIEAQKKSLEDYCLKLKELEKDIQDLLLIKQDQETKIKEILIKNQEYCHRISENDSIIINSKEKMDNLKKNIEDLEFLNLESNRSSDEKNNKILNLEKSLEDSINKMLQLVSEKNELKNKIDELNKLNEELNKSFNDLKLSKQEYFNRAENLDCIKEELMKKNNELENYIDELKNKLSELMLKSDETNKQAKENNAESNDLCAKKDSEIKELFDKLLVLQEGNKNLFEKNSELDSKYEKLTKENEEIKKTKEELLNKVKELGKIISDLNNKISNNKNHKHQQGRVNTEIDNEDIQLNYLIKENNELKEKIKTIENDISELTVIKNDFCSQMEIKKIRLAEVEEILKNKDISFEKLYETEEDLKNKLSESIIISKNLEKDNTNISEEKRKLEEKLIILDKSKKDMEILIETLNESDKLTKLEIYNLNSQLETLKEENSLNEKINEVLRKTIKTYKITFKQFFLMLLDDDIFIDLIEMTFAEEKQKIEIKENLSELEKSSQIFFEKIYSLSKFIKPKIAYAFLKSNCKNLNNQGLHNQLNVIINKKLENAGIPFDKSIGQNGNKSKRGSVSNSVFWEKFKKLNSDNVINFNLIQDNNFSKKIEEFSSMEINLQFLEKIDNEINDVESNQRNQTLCMFSDLLVELIYNVEYLQLSLNKANKIINDLAAQNKSAVETLEDSKKNESEKYDILNKNIQKLQQECRDFSKIEKLLKSNIESVENNLAEAKAENEKLSNKLKSLTNLYEELNNEKKSLVEKNISLTQQMENFKIENMEIIEKNHQRETLLKNLNDKLDILQNEKQELVIKVSEIRKLNDLISEKNSLLETKDIEIDKMRTSYSELEEFIESLKLEKEQSLEVFKKQIFELNSEIENNKETLLIQEDKLNQEKINHNEDLEKKITDLDIENKHLKEQKDKMKKYSEEILFKVKNDLKDTEYLVDKRLISNILVKYFDKYTNDKIKTALLDTLANFMGFTNDERAQIGLYANNTNVSSSNGNKNDKLKDLSDELYNFILNA